MSIKDDISQAPLGVAHPDSTESQCELASSFPTHLPWTTILQVVLSLSTLFIKNYVVKKYT